MSAQAPLQIRGRLSRPAEARSTREGAAVLRVCIEQAADGPEEIVCDCVGGVTAAEHIATRMRAAAMGSGTEVLVSGAGLHPGRAGPQRRPVLRLAGCSEVKQVNPPPPRHEPQDREA